MVQLNRLVITLLCLCSAVSPACAQGARARTSAVKMSPLDLERIHLLKADTPAAIPESLSLPSSGMSVYIPLHVEFKDAASRMKCRPPQGVTFFHEFDRFADAFLEERLKESIDDLRAMEGVVWIDVEMQRIQAPPPPKLMAGVEKSRAVSKIVRGGIDGLTGKGVVLAIVDDGLDFRHKDFITTDEKGKPRSRILWYWDTIARPTKDKPGIPAPFFYPNGAPIGVIYSRDELTAELQDPRGAIDTQGAGWHGTSCAGIAAGNGSSRDDRRFTGVAPNADIIAVRIGGKGPWNQYLLGAIASWLNAKAHKNPLVVSCSFGCPNQGGRDGCRVIERQLDMHFATATKGRAICIAIGNEAERAPFHGEVAFQGEEGMGILSWELRRQSALALARLTLFVDADGQDDIVMKFPTGDIRVVHRYRHALSKSLVFEVDLIASKPSSNGTIELWSKSRRQLRADAYIDTQPWYCGSFRGRGASKQGLLGAPETMVNAITVGSYDFNDLDDQESPPRILKDRIGKHLLLGSISTYSSPGYDRVGTIKPTIVAPGQVYLAPMANPLPDRAYHHFDGTSAATPYAAGVVALMLEKNPNLTFGEIKALLKTHATSDSLTGRTPNPFWGHGRLDYPAIVAIMKALK